MTYWWVWFTGKIKTVYEFVYGSCAATPTEDDTVLLRSIDCITYNQPVGEKLTQVVINGKKYGKKLTQMIINGKKIEKN